MMRVLQLMPQLTYRRTLDQFNRALPGGELWINSTGRCPAENFRSIPAGAARPQKMKKKSCFSPLTEQRKQSIIQLVYYVPVCTRPKEVTNICFAEIVQRFCSTPILHVRNADLPPEQVSNIAQTAAPKLPAIRSYVRSAASLSTI